MYSQPNSLELRNLIDSQEMSYLLTVNSSQEIKVGALNHFYDGLHFYYHLNKNDEQVESLKSNAKAKIFFHDFLSTIPSYWVDEKYAGAATSYYRYAEFNCSVEMIAEPEKIMQVLQLMMNVHQPEKKYEPLHVESKTYKGSFASLVIAKLSVDSSRTKWKLGQNRPREARLKVVDELKKRGQGHDLRTAQEVMKILSSTA